MGSLSTCPFVSGFFHFIMFSRLIPVICIYQGFLHFYCSIVFHCMEIPHFGFCLCTHQLADVWVVSSILAITYNATMKIRVQVFTWTCVVNALGHVHIWQWTASNGNGTVFEDLANCSPKGYTNTTLNFFKKRMYRFTFPPVTEGFIFSTSFPTLVTVFFAVVLVGVKKCLQKKKRNVYTPVPLMADKRE